MIEEITISSLIKKYEDKKKQTLKNIDTIKNEYWKYHRNSANLEVYDEILQDLEELKKEYEDD